MKNKLLIFFCFLAAASYAQKHQAPRMPIDDQTKKITYTFVSHLDSSYTKDAIYSAARSWIAKTYKSANDVLQMDDRQGGIIVGKGALQVYHKAFGADMPSGHINYTITIQAKDGRYRYEITDFYHKGQYVGGSNRVPDHGPCEDMINTRANSMGISYQKQYNYYLTQLDNEMRSLIRDMANYIRENGAIDTEDDW